MIDYQQVSYDILALIHDSAGLVLIWHQRVTSGASGSHT